MGTHVEWMGAREAAPDLLTPGQTWEGEEPESYTPGFPEDVVSEGNYAFALSGDDVVVIEGTEAELRTLVERMAALLDGLHPLPELPATPSVDAERGDTVTCPFVHDDGTVCGAEVNLWDKEPVRRDLRYVAGAYVAGPSRVADGGGGDEEVQCYELHSWAVPEIAEWQ